MARRPRRRRLLWIQDYHFALVADYLRATYPSIFVHLLWHIPFPPPDILRLLPSTARASLLRGLLGNDLIGFHTERYAQNFLDCLAGTIRDAEVDRLDDILGSASSLAGDRAGAVR